MRLRFLGLAVLGGMACAVLAAPARISIAVLHLDIPEQDSAEREEFARALGRDFAADSLFLVYDARASHGAALDQAFEEGDPGSELRRKVHGGEIRHGLFARCRLEESYREEGILRCRLGSWDLKEGRQALDSAAWVGGILRRPASLRTELLARLAAPFRPPPPIESAGPALRLIRPAQGARLLRRDAVLATGTVDSIPPGCVLRTGEMPFPALAREEDYHFVLFPHSSFGYPLPGVLWLHKGSLGVLRAEDTAGFAERLKPRLSNSSGPWWKSVAQLAAEDTANRVWKALGRSRGGEGIAPGALVHAAGLDSNSDAFRILEKLSASDSGRMLLRGLAEVAALDSGSLMWRGMGRVKSLGPADRVWSKLAALPPQKGGSLWREMRTLALHDNVLILTSSCVLRGRPRSLLLTHVEGLTRAESAHGEILVLPVLSTRQPEPLRDLEWGETHGYALERGKLSASRADALAKELASAHPRAGGGLTDLLPDQLFGKGRAIPTPRLSVQEHFLRAFSETGAAPEFLTRNPPARAAPGKGSDAGGCYLCRPDRLGR